MLSFSAYASAQQADLVLNHVTDPNPATVSATETVEATVTVDNTSGPSTANNVVMTYDFPATAEYVSHVTSAGACVVGASDLVCNLGNMPFNATETITVVFRITASVPAAVSVVASVASETPDPDLGNNSIIRNVTVSTGADMEMIASGNPAATVVSGDTLVYTLAALNNGPDSTSAITVVAQLPNGVTRTGALPAGCGQAGQTVTCTRAAALGSGDTWNIGSITTVVGVASPSNLVMSATVSSALTDGIQDNNTAAVNTAVTPGSDVYVTMSQAPGGARVVGDTFSLTLTPRFSGDVPQNLTMTATIAPELEIQNAANFSSNGWDCSVAGQTVTCTRANGGAGAGYEVGIGAVPISVTALGFGPALPNSVVISSTSPTDPNLANNNASLNVNVTEPDFDLRAQKFGPAENLRVIGPDGEFNFTIRVNNNSNIPYVGELTMTDNLPLGLQVQSLTANGWACTDENSAPLAFPVIGPAQIVCTREYLPASPLAAGANTPAVTLVSQANIDSVANPPVPVFNSMTMTYDPNPGYTYPADNNPGNNTTSVPITGFVDADSADLRVIKTASAPTVPAGEPLTYYIEIVNDGPDTAQDVDVTDTFSSLYTGSVPNSFQGASITANVATFNSCTNGGPANVGSRALTCNFTAIPPCDAGVNCPIIEVTILPMGNTTNGNDLTRNNTASVISNLTADSNYTNNSGSVSTTITSRPDLTVTKAANWIDGDTPNRAGTNLTYTIEAINLNAPSASGANTVTITDTLPLDVTFLSASATGGGTCGTTPGVGVTTTGGNRTVVCSFATMPRNTQQIITIVVRPNLSTHGSLLTNDVAIATVSDEVNLANNTASNHVTVADPVVDLATTVSDAPDPIQESETTTLTVTVRNNGPSVSENVVVYGVLDPTASGMTYLSDNASCTKRPNIGDVGAGAVNLMGAYWGNGTYDADLLNADFICQIGLMDVGAQVSFNVVMTGVTKGVYNNRFIARSQEHVDGFPDAVPGNDFTNENTTVRTTADMQVVSKTAAPGTVSLREPFVFKIDVTNAGPGTAYAVTLSDTLPAGMVLTAQPTVIANGGVNGPSTQQTCTGAAGDGAFNCDFGNVPLSTNITVEVPVVVNTWPASGTLTNSATVAVDPLQTRDPNEPNNTNTGDVTVVRSSLVGRVYEDINFNGAYLAPEPGINNVAMRLTGTDDFGNAVDLTVNTNASGIYTFSNLSPSTNGNGGGYTLTQTQPVGYLDGYETIGTSGGTQTGSIVDGDASDIISDIFLAADTQATGYNFGELRETSIGGWVFIDSNTNGVRDGGEVSGLPNLNVRLQGTDYTGTPVLINQLTVGNGTYQFDNLLPGTYTVIQTDMPTGMTATGPQLGLVSGNSSGTAHAAVQPATPPELRDVVLTSNSAGTNFNFGWFGQTISGFVYVDLDQDGVRSVGDRPLAGVSVTISGLTADGINVCDAIAPQPCDAVTQADGSYLFSDIPASNGVGYTLTQQATNTGVLVDYGDGPINVGTVNAVSTGAPGANAINGLVVGVGQSGEQYNFGHVAALLSGTVFYDINNDSIVDGTDERLPGVTVTLSGTTATGDNVCTVIGALNCVTTTDANGDFIFTGLPGSNVAGYTLVQTQPVDYVTGTNTVGGEGGVFSVVGGNPQFAQITVPGGSENGTDYLFAQRTGSISGFVYHDENADSQRGAAEERLEGITITLSGTTASGLDVCATIVSCVTTTAADGSYSFELLRNANPAGYTITRGAVPVDFIGGNTNGGLVDGVACVGCTTPTAAQITTIPFRADAANTEFDFLVLKPASVEGYLYIDADGNGTRDATDTSGLPNLTVRLSGTDYLGNAIVPIDVQSAAVAPFGFYRFEDLLPGTYTITQVGIPGGLSLTGYDIGTAGGVGNAATPPYQITGVNLQSGQDSTYYNFGWSGQGLSGAVYLDINRNGMLDGAEPGVAGVAITLSGTTSGGQNVCDVIAPSPCTVNTAADGTFTFTDLPASNGAGYTLTQQDVTLPPLNAYEQGDNTAGEVAGFPVGVADVNHISGIVIGDSEIGFGYIFGHYPLGELSGIVYVDANDNGIRDPGEQPLAGITMTLSGLTISNQNVCLLINCVTTTDANGYFEFTSLPFSNASGFSVTQAQPVEYSPGKHSVGSAGGEFLRSGNDVLLQGVNIALNQNGNSYYFAHVQGYISGRAFVDYNNNGLEDPSEPALPGVTMLLSGNTEAGVDVCSLVSCVSITDEAGGFSFSALPFADAGGYSVTQVQPQQYAIGINTPGSAGGVAGVDGGNAYISAISIFGQNLYGTNYVFAHLIGGISGYVYHDKNNNKQRDANDERLGGVPVTLSGRTANGDDVCTVVVCQVVTGSTGFYRFVDLPRSDVSGYTLTRGDVDDLLTSFSSGRVNGNNCVGCDTQDGAQIGSIQLDPEQSYTEFNFALIGKDTATNIISGYVYHDEDVDGQRDDGEPHLPGVTITLSGRTEDGQDVCDLIACVTVTDENGYYEFKGLPPSDEQGYTIVRGDVPDYANGKSSGLVDGAACPTCDTTDSTVIGSILFEEGKVYREFNFSVLRGNSLSGVVYVDNNDNGQQDASEPGIPGVTVVLTGETVSGQTITREVVTDANGEFVFQDLPDGTYQLEEKHPAGYLDGRETAGDAGGEVNNSEFSPAPEFNRITEIELTGGQDAGGYLFGNRGSMLTGYVYVDNNDNGAMDTSEPGIPGISVTLTGTTTTGQNIRDVLGCNADPSRCVAVSDADGYFVFMGIVPGTYTLVQDQNAVNLITNEQGHRLYQDGRETPGVSGGAVNNTAFGSQPEYNTISNIVITDAALVQHQGVIDGYLFGERPLDTVGIPVVPPVISGYVYMDKNYNRVRPQAVPDPRVAGWTVTLQATKTNGETEVICVVQTNDVGYYEFNNVTCNNAGYSQWVEGLPVTGDSSPTGGVYEHFDIVFSGEQGLKPLAQSGGEAGQPDEKGGRIVRIQLRPGDDVVEQNLPLDPAGVIYDSLTRQPISGATVTLLQGGVPVPESCLVDRNPVVTGDFGMYQFLLLNEPHCPGTGEYELQVTAPPGYVQGVSTLIPPTPGPLVPTFGSVFPVQLQDGPPLAGEDETYYLTMVLTITNNLTTSSSEVVNNHIPLDPILEGAVQVIKSTSRVNVSRGDLVPYTIQVRNTVAGTRVNLQVADLLPPGFQYVAGSAKVDGVPVEPVTQSRQLQWPPVLLGSEEPVTVELLLVVGSAVVFGDHVNRAWAQHPMLQTRISNIGEATVRVIPDPIFDCSDIIGRVFDDANRNGYQDEGEIGLAGVRLVTATGLLVTTDEHGRFHIACADVPDERRGANFILKLDDQTLPSGYRVTTENPRVVRVTQGRLTRINFGATIHRVVRLDLTADAFVQGLELREEYQERLAELVEILAVEQSVLRVAYHLREGASVDEARSRIRMIRDWMKENWAGQECCYDLLIEDEIVPATDDVEVIR